MMDSKSHLDVLKINEILNRSLKISRGPRPVSNVLRKSVRFFIINIFLIKKTFQVEIWKMDWTNALSEEN